MELAPVAHPTAFMGTLCPSISTVVVPASLGHRVLHAAVTVQPSGGACVPLRPWVVRVSVGVVHVVCVTRPPARVSCPQSRRTFHQVLFPYRLPAVSLEDTRDYLLFGLVSGVVLAVGVCICTALFLGLYDTCTPANLRA